MPYIKPLSSIKLWLAVVILLGGSSLLMFLNDYSHKGCPPMRMSLETVDEAYSCEVRVKEKDRYAVFLEYSFGSDNLEKRSAVREAVGDPVFKDALGKKYWTKQSRPIKVEAIISSIRNNGTTEIVSAVSEPTVSGRARDYMLAEIIRHELEPGTYRITVRNMKSVPAMQNINTNIVFQKAYEGK